MLDEPVVKIYERIDMKVPVRKGLLFRYRGFGDDIVLEWLNFLKDRHNSNNFLSRLKFGENSRIKSIQLFFKNLSSRIDNFFSDHCLFFNGLIRIDRYDILL